LYNVFFVSDGRMFNLLEDPLEAEVLDLEFESMRASGSRKKLKRVLDDQPFLQLGRKASEKFGLQSMDHSPQTD